VLDWRPQERAYVRVYDELLGRASVAASPVWPDADRRARSVSRPLFDRWGNRLVDLRDPAAVDRFARTRRVTSGVRG
jgi:hypothetical protein